MLIEEIEKLPNKQKNRLLEILLLNITLDQFYLVRDYLTPDLVDSLIENFDYDYYDSLNNSYELYDPFETFEMLLRLEKEDPEELNRLLRSTSR